MAEFVNTIDKFGDEETLEMLLTGMLTEYCDDVLTSFSADFRYQPNLAVLNLPKVTTAPMYMCSGCTKLTSVNLPECQTVNSYAFQTCSSLEEVDLPKATSVQQYAFAYCTNVRRLRVPMLGGVTGTYVFRNASLFNVLEFGTLKTSFSLNFLAGSFICAIVFPEGDVPTLSSDPTTNTTVSGTVLVTTGYIYVPESTIESWKAATNWSTLRFRAIEDYPAICKYDSDYVADGYTVIYQKRIFTTADSGTGVFTATLANQVVFEVGMTYLVSYDGNEYGIIATDEGLVHYDGNGELVFRIASPIGTEGNVLTTRAEAFSSVLGIYRATT